MSFTLFPTLRGLALGAALCAGSMMTAPAPAAAQEAFIGQIVMFGGNFAPRSWALCDGQLLSIASNSALFAILGTTYGGDGVSTFGLPDLRGRVAIHKGNGPGLSNYALGQKGGAEAVTLTTAQIPSHNHGIKGNDARGNKETPGGNVPAKKARDDDYSDAGPTVDMHPGMVANAGGGGSHPNIQPYLAVNYIIAVQGIFPSQN